MNHHLLTIACATALFGVELPGQTKRASGVESIVRRWQKKDPVADFWIYEDLAAGRKLAQQTGKPLLVTYRCVP